MHEYEIKNALENQLEWQKLSDKVVSLKREISDIENEMTKKLDKLAEKLGVTQYSTPSYLFDIITFHAAKQYKLNYFREISKKNA